MEDGAFGKAVRHLMSDGLLDAADPEVQNKLRDLHPRAPEIVCTDPLRKPFPFPSEDSSQEQRELTTSLRETLLSFPRAAAGGPDGLRPQHLQDVVRVDAGAASLVLAALSTFTRAALAGTLPTLAMPFVTSASLIPLRKTGPSTGINVRPIAVGNTIRRFVGKFAMNSSCVKQCAAALQPHQCGVAMEGACETVAQGLQTFIQNETGTTWAVLQVDLQNAFNVLDRRALLHAVRARAPELEGWARSTYATHSALYSHGHRMTSEQGVQQGDPLGPLFFALTWQEVVLALPKELLLNVWYLDDGHLVGSVEALAAAIAIINASKTSMGV
jgi:hypothetical protein